MNVVVFDNSDYPSIEDEALHEERHTAYDRYKEKYGLHFNEKLAKFAISKMKRNNSSTGEVESISSIPKGELDSMLIANNITIDNNKLYDYVYVANMCKADFYGSSILDERHLCLYVKDVIDDADGYEGLPFVKWLADAKHTGLEIDWESMM